jgi:hypothetical protein
MEDGHGQDILGHFAIHLENGKSFCLGLFGGGVQGVTFLPEELRGAQEGTGHFLPAQDVAPLVQKDGQVTPGLHPLRVHRTDHGLRRGPDGERLFELFPAADRHPGAFGGETLDVVRFLLQEALRNEEGKVGVLVAEGLDPSVGLGLKIFPDRVSIRADDHAALDRAVVGKLGLEDNIEIPLGKVHRGRGNFFECAFFHEELGF